MHVANTAAGVMHRSTAVRVVLRTSNPAQVRRFDARRLLANVVDDHPIRNGAMNLLVNPPVHILGAAIHGQGSVPSDLCAGPYEAAPLPLSPSSERLMRIRDAVNQRLSGPNIPSLLPPGVVP